jgi:RimJ/RimL family protein N-acetyltransferase
MDSITFEKITEDDLPFLNSVRNSYANKYLHDSRIFTLKETIEWFKKTNPKYYIILKDNIRVGYFRLSNYSKENMNIYVGADISPEFVGLGIGYLSYKKFLSYIFIKYNLNKVSLEVLSTNTKAIGLYKKLGFVVEGVKREEIKKGGVFVDSIIMSLLKKELNNEF